MKLYYTTATRAIRPRWLLEEMGVPYELVRIDPTKGDNRAPEYLQVNPLGHLPAFVDDDGRAIVESAAIILHLADKFPEKRMAPPPGTSERAEYYQWIIYAMATLEPLVVTVNRQMKLPEAERVPSEIDYAKRRFASELRLIDTKLAGREFLVAGTLTAADVVMASVLGYARINGMMDEFPALVSYSKNLASRPAAKRARE
jgi:glutathione S-transferase